MTKSIKLPYKLLIYDIETGLLKAHIFRPGEQVVRHTQLDVAHNENSIICISAKWYGQKEVFVFTGDNAVEEFDKLARQADVCLGKNSDKFDVKHINTARMMQGLKPYPEWMDTNEDLEKQLRKHFAFPSQSLDYISGIMGFGGKEKMEFSDWVAISNLRLANKIMQTDAITNELSQTLFKENVFELIQKGEKALKKMIHYNKKDVTDTEAVLKRVLPYIRLKHDASNRNGCTLCGSKRIEPTKIVTIGKTKYQQFECLSHGGYAGKATYKWGDKSHHKIYGTIGK
jgi:hypothetical protein